MKLFQARPPAVTPPNPPTWPGLIVYAKAGAGTGAGGSLDPYRANIINLETAPNPRGIECTIGGQPGACTLAGLDLNDGDRVSILWSRYYTSPLVQFKHHYGRGDMVYNAAAGRLEDDEHTIGHDWTNSRWWDEDYEEYVDFRPDYNTVYAFVNCTVHDLCVYWDLAPRWTGGASCVACEVPQTAIVSGPAPDYDPVVADFAGYAWPLDWYWEWEYYGEIFDH